MFISSLQSYHIALVDLSNIYIYLSRHFEVQLYRNLMQTSGQQ